jgi:hypothetical protein
MIDQISNTDPRIHEIDIVLWSRHIPKADKSIYVLYLCKIYDDRVE